MVGTQPALRPTTVNGRSTLAVNSHVSHIPFDTRDGEEAIGGLFDAGQPDRVDSDEAWMRLSGLGQASKPPEPES